MEDLDLNIDNMFTMEDLETTTDEKNDVDNKDNDKESAEQIIDGDTLFKDAEGVGTETEDTQGEDNNLGDKGSEDTSPKENFYSVTAKAFKEDGIFPNLSDEDIKTVKSAEDFADLVQKQINAGLDESQRKIKDALEGGVDSSEIQEYEQTIQYLNSLNEEVLSSETKESENIRKQIIYQDYINKGFSKERAAKEVDKSIKAGTDIEDALESLEGNKEHFKSKYDDFLNIGKKEKEESVKRQQKQYSDLNKKITDTSEPFKGLKLTDNVKKQIKDTILKPVYKDDDGVQYNAIQKLFQEDPVDYQYKLGLIFTLTDGFKNLDGLVKGEIQRQSRKNIKEIEHVLNSSSITSDGSINYMGNTDDTEKNIGLQLDV